MNRQPFCKIGNRFDGTLVTPLRLPILLSFGGYVVLAVWFPLFPHYNRVPTADINTFITSIPAFLGYIALFGGLYFLYHRLYQTIRQQEKGPAIGLIVLVTILFALPLLVAFPVNATDIYRYFVRGRISSIHQESPYLVTAAELGTAEPYLPLAGEWAAETSPYGPLWEASAAVVTAAVPNNLLLAMLLFKGVAVVCYLLIGGLIWL